MKKNWFNSASAAVFVLSLLFLLFNFRFAFAVTASDLQFDSGEGSLQVIRGHVDASGNKISGAGFISFAAGYPSNGIIIDFTTTFADTPSIVATADNPASPFKFVSLSGATTGGTATILGFIPTGGGVNPGISGFDFIAVGKAAASSPCIQSPERLYVLRGTVGGNGSIAAGSGFTANGSGGRIALSFPAGMFTAPPAVVAVANNGTKPDMLATLGSTPTANGASIYTYGMNGPLASIQFDFIAAGPTSDTTGCPVRYVDNETAGRIIRGRISSFGTVAGGTGFTSNQSGIYYNINYTPAFLDAESGASTIDDLAQNANIAVGSGGTLPSGRSIILYSPTGRTVNANFNFLTVAQTTPTPPVIFFTASPSTVNAGQPSTLTWIVSGANSCNASASPADAAWSGAKGTSGSQSVTPANTTTYTLSCTGPDPTTVKSITVTVATPPPAITSFSASPASITLGQSTTLNWSTTNATACTISGPGAPSGSQPPSGSASATPLSAGTSTYTMTCNGPGGASQPAAVNVAVSAAVGTITVNSESSVNNGQVPATWAFSGPANPCVGYGGSCNDVSQATYSSLPIGGAVAPYNLVPGYSNSGLYVLHSVENQEVAKNSNFFNSLLSKLGGWLFAPAFADRTCAGYNTSPNTSTSACPLTQTMAGAPLINNGDTDNFIIFWDPVANLTLSQGTLNLTAPSNTATTSAQISVANSGGAQDSSMTWTESVAYGSGGSGWLSVSPSLGGPLLNNASQTLMFVANPSGLASGTYTATTTFVANIAPGKQSQATLSVTFSVPAANGGGGISITINSPAPVANVPTSFTCTDNGACGWTAPGASVTSTSGSDNCDLSATYGSAGTSTVTCTTGGSSTSTSFTVAPDCTIVASPASIVPPQASTLTWNCSPGTATSCQIIPVVNQQAGAPIGVCGLGVGPCTKGTVNETPTQNTTYELSCNANNGFNTAMPTTSASVSVQGPGTIEVNPGG